MEWLSALKGLVKAKVDAAIHLTAKSDVNLKKGSENKTQSLTFHNGGNVNIITINAGADGQLPAAEMEKLRAVLVPAFESGDVMFLQDTSKELLTGYNRFEASPDVKELLSFFQGKIKQSDCYLLETGLYEAYLIEQGDKEKAQQIKSTAVNRFGLRAKNIINLASVGYFATHIRPLYEALSAQADFDKADFDREYEQIVEELPFAIFVHSGISEEEILRQLTEKTNRNVQYGVKEDTIIINGFGQNADRIEALLPELRKRYARIAPNTHYLGALKSIQVSVYYRETL